MLAFCQHGNRGGKRAQFTRSRFVNRCKSESLTIIATMGSGRHRHEFRARERSRILALKRVFCPARIAEDIENFWHAPGIAW